MDVKGPLLVANGTTFTCTVITGWLHLTRFHRARHNVGSDVGTFESVVRLAVK